MIESIKHKGLKLLWEKDDSSKLPQLQVEKIRRILTSLDIMTTLKPLQGIPGYRLHRLKGKLNNYYVVTVTGNYRIIFRFEEESVLDIDYIGYH